MCRTINTEIPLRIVTWNCNMAFDRKVERLLALRPDVAIIQECASPDRGARGWRSVCSACDWIGFNPDKGLGILTFGDLTLSRDAAYSDAYSLYLPVAVQGRCSFHLLGVWVADPRRIPSGSTNEPAAAISYYAPFLAAAPSVVAGDFNRLPQQMSARAKSGPGTSVVELLGQAGLANGDYMMSDATGQETLRRTHYHQRHFQRGFVVDYIFIPEAARGGLSAFEVGDPHDWLGLSDHVPLVVEFDLPACP